MTNRTMQSAKVSDLSRSARVVVFASLAFTIPVRAQSLQPRQLVREASIDASENDLSPINWLAVSQTGLIAIGQPQDHRINFFTESGKSAGFLGRRGAGPGEFGSLTLHGWLGDTLWVGDFDTRRLTLMLPEGALLRTQPWPPNVNFADDVPRPRPSFIFAVPWAVQRDGAVLSYAELTRSGSVEWLRQPQHSHGLILRTRKDGLYEKVVAWLPYPNVDCYIEVPGKGNRPKPLCFQPFWLVSPYGGLVVVVDRERADARTDIVRVVALNAQGDTVLATRINAPRVPIPRVVADSVRGAFLTMAAKGQPAGVPAPAVPLPESFPPFTRVLISKDEKSVWLERGSVVGPRLWHILTIEGRAVVDISVPRSVELKVVGPDRAWGIERDNDGLESVRLYRVRP